jgi:aldehyde dehydrogenase (NAD+)
MDELVAMTVAEYGGPGLLRRLRRRPGPRLLPPRPGSSQPENFEETNGNATITRVPVGVAGLLTPWNGNPWFVCGKAASALAAGCTVVIKPSELSTLESQILAATS